MNRLALTVMAVLAVGTAPALGQTQPAHVRGVIVDYANNVLSVGTVNGTVKVRLDPNASVRVISRLSLGDIKPGSFVGCSAVPAGGGNLRALEIHVFPPAQAAAKPGEGSRPWDLFPQSSMTNGTVTDISSATVQGIRNGYLTLTYKDGEKKVFVSPDTPIVTYGPADRTALVPGQRVVILNAVPSGDGYTASSVTVGKNGVAPPM